jgi:agmatinase
VETPCFGCAYSENSKYIVLGIPFDHSTTYKPGTRFAPQRIREVSCNIEYYSVYTNTCFDNIRFNDLGDIVPVPGNLAESLNSVSRVINGVREDYGDDKKLIILGGEHTITYPVMRSIGEEIDSLIIFDAHLDLRDEYLGSKINHATHLRRILDEGLVSNVYVLGYRAASEGELEYLSNKHDHLKTYSVLELVDSSKFIEEINRGLGKTYISIDIDVLDPSYAPGTSNPESLGLDPFKLLSLINNIIRHSSSIYGFDIVEVNPMVDINDVTSILASKIIFEIIGFIEKYSK